VTVSLLIPVLIENINYKVDCPVALFTDNTLMYQTITSQQDAARFQHNLNSLDSWACRMGMSFNVKKARSSSSVTRNSHIIIHLEARLSQLLTTHCILVSQYTQT